jgi:PST family polysaccharide transporter
VALAGQTLRSIASITAAKVFAQLVSTAVSVVLARLLVPADFGLLAMSAVVTGFVSLFGELGLGAALVQRDEVDEVLLSTVFWTNLGTGVALGAIVAGISPLMARFYDEPRLLPLMLVTSAHFLVAPLNMVHNVLLTRQMQFGRMAVVETIAMLVSTALVLLLASLGYGVWSLAAQGLCSTGVACVALWSISPWRPRLVFSWPSVKSLMRFSGNLLGFATINYWARRADDLLVGKTMGADMLGIYDRAYSVMMLPVSEVSSVLGRVMFPTMSRLRDDHVEVRRYWLRALSTIALITFPAMLFVSVLSEPVVLVIYGPRWLAAAPVLRILCIVGMFQSLGTTVGWIYQSQGRTDIMLRWGAIASSLIIASLVTGVLLGSLQWIALCYAVMTVGVLSYPQFSIPGRLIGLPVRRIVGAVSGVFACAAVMAAVIAALNQLLAAHVAAGPRLLMLLLGGLGIYWGLLAAFRVDAYVTVADRAVAWIRRRAQEPAPLPTEPASSPATVPVGAEPPTSAASSTAPPASTPPDPPPGSDR